MDIEPSNDSTLVDKYLSAPTPIKGRIRQAIGARNDDEAIKLINTDSKAAQTAIGLLSESPDNQSLVGAPPASPAPEDVLYPRAK